jgi:hypothetical protein
MLYICVQYFHELVVTPPFLFPMPSSQRAHAAAPGSGSPFKMVPIERQAAPDVFVKPFAAVENNNNANASNFNMKRRSAAGPGVGQSRNALKRMLDKLGLSDADAGVFPPTNLQALRRSFLSFFLPRV